MHLLLLLQFLASSAAGFRLSDLIDVSAGPDSSECEKDFARLLASARDGEEWASRMLDSWGNAPAGRYLGNTIDYGHFDQCINTQSDHFDPLYCLLPLSEKKRNNNYSNNETPLPFKSAVCVPGSCSKEMVKEIVSGALRNAGYESAQPIERCIDNKRRQFGAFECIATAAGVIILLLVASSTAYEACTGRSDAIWTAFSLLRNFPKLVDTQTDREERVLGCLDGIRVLTLFWIVVMHLMFYLMDFMNSLLNERDFEEAKSSLWYMALLQAQLGSDTFLVIGGLLVSHNFLKAREKGEPFHLLDFYFHRWIRLTPTKALAMAISVLVYNVKYGPVYNLDHWLGREDDNCRTWWWAGLLYSQNYINPLLPCLPPTWYQHVDVHMFVVSPLLLFAIWRLGYLFVPFLVALMAASNYVVYRIALENEFDMVSLPMEFFEKIYVKTHARFSTWMLGFLLGYVLHRRKDAPKTLGKAWNLLSWVVLIASVFFSIVSSWLYLDQNDNLEFVALVHPLHRLQWALLICLIVYKCARGQGGAVNWLLSLPLWKPLVRLNYSIFLSHVIWITLTGRLLRNQMSFHPFLILQMGLGTYLVSLLVAIPMTLCVEMPFVNLETDLKSMRKEKIKLH